MHCTFPDHHHASADMLGRVEFVCAERGLRLTELRRRVFELIADSSRPVKAYDLLERIRKQGSGPAAPPTVYRALDFLMSNGFVHRLESLNAYVPCPHPEAQAHGSQFLICEECHETMELDAGGIAERLRTQSKEQGFEARRHVIEVYGLCEMPRALILVGLLFAATAFAQELPPSAAAVEVPAQELPKEAPSPVDGDANNPATGTVTPPAGAVTPSTAAAPSGAPEATPAVLDGALELLGERVPAGSRQRLSWQSGATFIGDPMHVPVTVIHGAKAGPILCLTGAIHGDELNGVEVIRRVLGALDEHDLVGTVIGIPIVNMAGFSRGSRYLPDRRDLNRFFPGNVNGSSASRIARDFFDQVVRRCDALVDFHTGSFDRSNLPQVRGDMRLATVVELTRGFGATAVLHTPGAPGMLRRAATDAGIPAVTFELGAPVRLEPVEIEHGVSAIETLMNNLGMTQRVRQWREPQPIFYESRWVRVMRPGMLFADVKLGDKVRQGQRLGRVVNPLNDETSELVAPIRGRVLGMALNQVVLPGYAAFHVGEEASEAQVIRDAAQPTPTVETERMDEGAPAASTEGSTEQVEDYMPETDVDTPE